MLELPTDLSASGGKQNPSRDFSHTSLGGEKLEKRKKERIQKRPHDGSFLLVILSPTRLPILGIGKLIILYITKPYGRLLIKIELDL